jgi:hypothetical protein
MNGTIQTSSAAPAIGLVAHVFNLEFFEFVLPITLSIHTQFLILIPHSLLNILLIE